MSKFTQYLKATAIAMLIPFSAHAQKKASADNTKVQIASLTKAAGKYNLWDDRKTTDYDAAKDFLKYPVTVNYTVDSLAYADELNAYFQEAIVVNFERDDPLNFEKRLPRDLVHESLHYIQKAKINKILEQHPKQGLTFEQAYLVSMYKEIAAHIGDRIAVELANKKQVDLPDIAKIANNEIDRYLTGEGKAQCYKTQYFNDAQKLYSPDATEESGREVFLKAAAAIMSQYVEVNQQMESINLLPLLTDHSLNLIKVPAGEMQKFENEKEGIQTNRRSGHCHSGINAEQKLMVMKRRLAFHRRKDADDAPYPLSTRSPHLSMDVSAYFPSMSATQFKQAKDLIGKFVQNEAAGNHADNQATLNQFIGAKDKTAIQTASLMATETRVNR